MNIFNQAPEKSQIKRLQIINAEFEKGYTQLKLFEYPFFPLPLC